MSGLLEIGLCSAVRTVGVEALDNRQDVGVYAPPVG